MKNKYWFEIILVVKKSITCTGKQTAIVMFSDIIGIP